MNKLLYFAMFTAGATIGSFATWQYVKTKYEKIAQDEIDSVKETLLGIKNETENDSSNMETENKFYDSKIDNSGNFIDYSSYSTSDALKKNEYLNKELMEKAVEQDKPYIIMPEEFGEEDDYENCTLFYYSDGLLVTADDEVITDIEETVGYDSLNHFGEYEDDSVCVRNDTLKKDYEILLDQRSYKEAMESRNNFKESITTQDD